MDDKIKKIKELVAQDKKKEAIGLLYDMVVQCAKSQQFQRAEKLREKMLQIDSMAITEIVGAAEIIESEKARSIDLGHKRLWAKLYETMTEAEANDFYFTLKKINLPAGKMIMQQGRVNNRLFFVDSGRLNVICTQDKRDIYLKKTAQGEPVGIKTFFTISYATTTVITEGPVSFHFLEREAFNRLVEKHPGIDARIENICRGLVKEGVEDILKQKSIERRQYKRLKITGKVLINILNTQGQHSAKTIPGVLSDISRGGVAFELRQGKKQTARSLLGTKALLEISPDTGLKLSQEGRVISVFDQLFNNYLINFKFTTPLTETKMNTLKS